MFKYCLKSALFIALFMGVLPARAQVRHVILISIDGFHPDMYTATTWPAPNLRQLLKMGTYADHLLSVFPSYTYPSHTAMVTGAYPARSKINFNQPIGSRGDWFWC
jgi:predicted AlkP superfamily pyrophosphatase or phosphodiesterase